MRYANIGLFSTSISIIALNFVLSLIEYLYANCYLPYQQLVILSLTELCAVKFMETYKHMPILFQYTKQP